MSKEIIQLNEGAIKEELRELVRGSVEETLNSLLEKEAQELTQAARYERTQSRQGYRSGHYERSLTTTSGNVSLRMPRLKGIPFETAIIERYRRRESSVEEALIEMYLAGVSVRRVEDITEALWGTRVSPATISELNKKVYGQIEIWRNRKLDTSYPYVYLDGIVLKRSWAGEVRNVSVLVAIGVDSDGFREVLGVCEGAKEDEKGWGEFLSQLKQRGLTGVQLVISDKCLGLVESSARFFPEAQWQRCCVHWYRNIFSHVPNTKVREVAAMLKAIHAQEDQAAAEEKARLVAQKLQSMKLPKAADMVTEGVQETLSYYHFPREHWRQLRTNNPLERIMREIRRRTRVVGCFPDGHSALMLAAARLRYITGTQWGTRRYLNMEHLCQQATAAAAIA